MIGNGLMRDGSAVPLISAFTVTPTGNDAVRHQRAHPARRLKVARTIADLAGEEGIGLGHLAEAY